MEEASGWDEVDEAMSEDSTKLARLEDGMRLPPMLLGQATPEPRRHIAGFYDSDAAIFERWVARRESPHTRRAFRRDVMAFRGTAEIRRPDDATRMRCGVLPLRAPTATLLLDAGADIVEVRDLLWHSRVTTMQIYDKRRRGLKVGASHAVPS